MTELLERLARTDAERTAQENKAKDLQRMLNVCSDWAKEAATIFNTKKSLSFFVTTGRLIDGDQAYTPQGT